MMGKNKKHKRKMKKTRSFLAIIAWFRNSAGQMKDKKKDKKRRRQWKQRKNHLDE